MFCSRVNPRASTESHGFLHLAGTDQNPVAAPLSSLARRAPLIRDRARVTWAAVAPLRVVLVLVVWLAATQVRAQAAPTLEVAWNAKGIGEPCSKPEGVEAEVLALAGSSAAQESALFSIEIEALPEGRQLLRVTRDSAGARSRELATCAEAREAAVLIMATALGAEPSVQEAPAAPAEPQETGGSIAAELGVAPRFTLTLSTLLDVYTLPGVGAGPALSAGYAHGLLRTGVSARYLPARAAPDVPGGAAMRIDSFAGSVHLGALFRFASTAFGPRAELELGNLRGRASGVEEKVTRSTFYAALLAGAELELWLHSRIGLSLLVLVGPALRRPRFALEDNAATYTSKSLVLRAGLGITVRIDPKD
jgi:hypothetical protein